MTEMFRELTIEVAADGIAGLVRVNNEFIGGRVRLVLSTTYSREKD